MRDLLGEYGGVIASVAGGSMGIAMGIMVFRLCGPLLSQILKNMM